MTSAWSAPGGEAVKAGISSTSFASQELHDIVKQCLQKDPAQRPSPSQLLKHQFFQVPLSTSP